MDFNLRQKFNLTFILVCFCTYIYFYYSSNNASCDYQINFFRLVCKGLNKAREQEPIPPHLNKHDIDALIEDFSKRQSELLRKDNKTIHLKKRVELLKTSSRPLTTPFVEWIDPAEGKKQSDYGDNTCGDNKYRKSFTAIFTKWIEIATKLNISYFLTCGSLLGAWRSGDVIPYDLDMDILIDHRDAIKLDKIKSVRNNFSLYDGKIRFVIQEDWRLPVGRRRMLSCDGRHVPAYEGECSFESLLGRVLKDGLHLDVFDYNNVNGFLHDPTVPGGRYDVQDIFPLKKCRYLGQVTYCPNRPIAVLNKFYGRNLNPHTICKNGTWIKRH